MPATEAELLAAIYADPGADAPREVYMDFLAERGDPRGEFMALQLARARSSANELPRKEARREAELLEAHRERWLGDMRYTLLQIASHITIDRKWHVPPEFERGFVTRGTIVQNVTKKQCADPALRTCTDLCGDIDLLPFAQLPALRRLRPRVTGWLDQLPTWLDLLERVPHLEHVACNHTAVVRTPDALVVRIAAHYRFGPNDFFRGLFTRSPAAWRGWRIELVTFPDRRYARAEHDRIAREWAAQIDNVAIDRVDRDAVL